MDHGKEFDFILSAMGNPKYVLSKNRFNLYFRLLIWLLREQSKDDRIHVGMVDKRLL